MQCKSACTQNFTVANPDLSARETEHDQLSESESSLSEHSSDEAEAADQPHLLSKFVGGDVNHNQKVANASYGARDCTNENPPSTFRWSVPDNPDVPEVNGLNSMKEEDLSYIPRRSGCHPRMNSCIDEMYSNQGSFSMSVQMSDETTCGGTGMVGSGDDLGGEDYIELNENAPDLMLFDKRELVVLLLAHDIAQARRQNWRLGEKFAGAKLWPLVSEEMAMEMHRLFEGDGIIEVIGVFAAFELLNRWTTCFDYRMEGLDGMVRQFVKTGVGRRLGVAKVGQRNMCSAFSEGLRGDCRSLRLPRHAVVPVGHQYTYLRQMSAL